MKGTIRAAYRHEPNATINPTTRTAQPPLRWQARQGAAARA